MTTQIEAVIPNIGDASDIEVIEILVNLGDSVDVETPLLTLETDKASMDVPSMHAGIVASIAVNVGDKVSEGSVILMLDAASIDNDASATSSDKKTPVKEASVQVTAASQSPVETQTVVDIIIPDIGDTNGIDVIDVMVNVGDVVEKDQAIMTLEGDKATMDIPSSHAGTVESMCLKVGDKVSQGDVILTLKSMSAAGMTVSANVAPNTNVVAETASKVPVKKEVAVNVLQVATSSTSVVYASPSVRRLAREFGVDLTLVDGSGRKARIVKEDIQSFVKGRLAQPQGNAGIPQIASIDFSKFGSIETKPLNKIKRLTAQSMSRSWLNVPHVTQFDEADISDLEVFRKANKEAALAKGAKLTPLAFIVQAVVKALQAFPNFNSSLDAKSENLIIKNYYNIGIAVDTPNGLVVPLIKNAETKGLLDLARDMAELGNKARNKKLTPADMSGGCFTISSLGGIGGTAFTPIVNAPEVAILGVSKAQIKPIYNGKDFDPRLMLPLSLSYDHRVIDGAEAARFSTYLCQCLSDIRTLLL